VNKFNGKTATSSVRISFLQESSFVSILSRRNIYTTNNFLKEISKVWFHDKIKAKTLQNSYFDKSSSSTWA
jgi:hypothetical protein